MTVQELSDYLDKYKDFADLNEEEKLLSIRRAINAINDLTSQIEQIYFSSVDTQSVLQPLWVQKIPNITLGQIGNYDAYMKEDIYLSQLTENDRIIVYNIAQNKIQNLRNYNDHQHYKINTYRSDPHIDSFVYVPLFKVAGENLTITDYEIVYDQLMERTASILSIIDYNTTLIVPLTRMISMLTSFEYIAEYEPLMDSQASIIQDKLLQSFTYGIIMNKSASIVSENSWSTSFDVPLEVSIQIIQDVDMTIEKIFIVPLNISYSITKGD
jgi:hypothetical protein